MLAKGLSNEDISKKLFLSEGTVRNHISSIVDKLGVSDRTPGCDYGNSTWVIADIYRCLMTLVFSCRDGSRLPFDKQSFYFFFCFK